MRLIIFAIYLGIGALLHALIVGPRFDWASAWTFAWLFGWPLMLFITFWVAVATIAMLCVAVWMAYSWVETIANWRAKRKRSTQRAS